MHERLMSAGVRRTARAKKRASSRVPIVSLGLLVLLVALCLLADLLAPGDPSYMDLTAAGQAPSAAHPLGTDALGRDVFAMLLHGGRVSLFIGACAAGISALVGSIYGAAAALAPGWLHDLLMRGAELLLSLPGILLAILLQAALGEANMLSLSLVIGLTGWMPTAKLVRSQVLQMRGQEYIQAARGMGAGFSICFSGTFARRVPLHRIFGDWQYGRRHRLRGHAELSWHWPSGGGGFLGKPVASFPACAAHGGLVDGAHPGRRASDGTA